jgi:hypothetical protein
VPVAVIHTTKSLRLHLMTGRMDDEARHAVSEVLPCSDHSVCVPDITRLLAGGVAAISCFTTTCCSCLQTMKRAVARQRNLYRYYWDIVVFEFLRVTCSTRCWFAKISLAWTERRLSVRREGCIPSLS